MSIQQEWDQVIANDPDAFNRLSSKQKANAVRRFVQAEAGKYGGGKNQSVRQFIETKLNEYQPVKSQAIPTFGSEAKRAFKESDTGRIAVELTGRKQAIPEYENIGTETMGKIAEAYKKGDYGGAAYEAGKGLLLSPLDIGRGAMMAPEAIMSEFELGGVGTKAALGAAIGAGLDLAAQGALGYGAGRLGVKAIGAAASKVPTRTLNTLATRAAASRPVTATADAAGQIAAGYALPYAGARLGGATQEDARVAAELGAIMTGVPFAAAATRDVLPKTTVSQAMRAITRRQPAPQPQTIDGYPVQPQPPGPPQGPPPPPPQGPPPQGPPPQGPKPQGPMPQGPMPPPIQPQAVAPIQPMQGPPIGPVAQAAAAPMPAGLSNQQSTLINFYRNTLDAIAQGGPEAAVASARADSLRNAYRQQFGTDIDADIAIATRPAAGTIAPQAAEPPQGLMSAPRREIPPLRIPEQGVSDAAAMRSLYQAEMQRVNAGGPEAARAAASAEQIGESYFQRFGTDIVRDLFDDLSTGMRPPFRATVKASQLRPEGKAKVAGIAQAKAARRAQGEAAAPIAREAAQEQPLPRPVEEPAPTPVARQAIEPEAPAPAAASKPVVRRLSPDELKRRADEAEVDAAAAEVRHGADSPEFDAAKLKAIDAVEAYNAAKQREAQARKVEKEKGVTRPPEGAPIREVIRSIKPAGAEPEPKGLMSKGAPKVKSEPPKLTAPEKPVKKKEVTPKKAEAAEAPPKPKPKELSPERSILPKYGRGLQEAAREAEGTAAGQQARNILSLARKHDELNSAYGSSDSRTIKANSEFFAALEKSDDSVFKTVRKFENNKKMLDESVVSKTNIPAKRIDLDPRVEDRSGGLADYDGTIYIPGEDRGYAWRIVEFDGKHRYWVQNTKITRNYGKEYVKEFGRDRSSKWFKSKDEAEAALAKELNKIWRLETVGVKPNRAAQLRNRIKKYEQYISNSKSRFQEINDEIKNKELSGIETKVLRQNGVRELELIDKYNDAIKGFKRELENIEATSKKALSEEPGTETSKKLIHKEGGDPTDSVLMRFVKEEDGFFDPTKLRDSVSAAFKLGSVGVREIIAAIRGLMRKVITGGVYSFLSRQLPRFGDFVEFVGQKTIVRSINRTGDLLVDYAMKGKTPASRAFARKVGEVLRRSGQDNAEAFKRIMRTPARTSNKVYNELSNAWRRFFIGEFGQSKTMIDAAQAIENQLYIDMRNFLENAVYIEEKYGKDSAAIEQFGRNVEDPNYTGADIDVYTTKALVQQISKWMLDVDAITEGAYKTYGEMGNYLPRIYRKWVAMNPDRAGLSTEFLRVLNDDPRLSGYEHRGQTKTMTRANFEKAIAEGVDWKELGTLSKSKKQTAAAEKAIEKANDALASAKDKLKEAIKEQGKADRLTPAPDGSDISRIKAAQTRAKNTTAVARERVKVAEKNLKRAESDLEKTRKSEKVEAWRDWTEDEMNKFQREWNPVPAMVRLYQNALRDLKAGRMLEYLRTGSDEMGRYAKSPEELGIDIEGGKALPLTVLDEADQTWVYLSPTEKAAHGVIKKYGKLSGNYVRDDIASYLKFHNQHGLFRTLVYKIKKYTGINAFKESKTVWSTKYYVNNFHNAMPMVELAGGSVTDMPSALKEIVENTDLVKRLERENIIRSGQMARQLSIAADSIIKKGLEQDGVLTHVNAATSLHKAAMNLAKTRENLLAISQATDDLWRLTLYRGLTRRQKLSHEEAIKIVRDAVYDSKRVTSPAADMGEIVIPFAKATAWMLDQTITNSIRNPHKLAYLYAIAAGVFPMIAKMQASPEKLAAEEEAIDDPLKESPIPLGWPNKIRLGERDGVAIYWDTKNFGGLHSIAAEVGNSGLSYWPQGLSFGGPWWVLVQVAMNYDYYRKEQITPRDNMGRDITIDSNFLTSPVSEYIFKSLAPTGLVDSWGFSKSMMGIPEKSGRVISPLTKAANIVGYKIREVDLQIQAPKSMGRGDSSLNQWRDERNNQIDILNRMHQSDASESAIQKQLDVIERWNEKIRELTEEEANRVLKLQEGMVSD